MSCGPAAPVEATVVKKEMSAVIAVAVSKECQPNLLPATARQAIARYARALRMELRAMLRNTRLRQSMSQTQLIAQTVRAVVRA
jgi:hypothetical protein